MVQGAVQAATNPRLRLNRKDAHSIRWPTASWIDSSGVSIDSADLKQQLASTCGWHVLRTDQALVRLGGAPNMCITIVTGLKL